MSALAALVSAAVFVVMLVAVNRRRADRSRSALEAATRSPKPHDAEEPASLTAARRLVVAAGTADGVHRRLRPALAELVEARLRDHHAIGLADPRAATLVGDELWSIVRPNALAPSRTDGGLAPNEIRSLLDRLETL